jgi:hypothetical protein
MQMLCQNRQKWVKKNRKKKKNCINALAIFKLRKAFFSSLKVYRSMSGGNCDFW